MIDALLIIATMFATCFIICFGIMSAFYPIDDKDTTTFHRVVTLVITTLIVSLLWSLV